MDKIKLPAFVFLLISICIEPYPLPAQPDYSIEQFLIDPNLPDWLLLEKGIAAFEQRDFGLALTTFRLLARRNPQMPEAGMWIGKIFIQDGEYELAAQQFQDALDSPQPFYNPEDRYTLLYSLAEINLILENYSAFETHLKTIIADESGEKEQQRQTMYSVLLRSGLYRVFELYRDTDAMPFISAYNQLAAFYFQSGRRRMAAAFYLHSTIAALSQTARFIKRYDPWYEHDSIAGFIDKTRQYPPLAAYLAESELYSSLYFLAHSLYFQEEKLIARQIWTVIAENPSGGRWQTLAARNLAEPEATLSLMPNLSGKY